MYKNSRLHRRFNTKYKPFKCSSVDKLQEIKAIEECKYPLWVSNPIVVNKKNGKDRVCIDFINLNKACPKDNYPLSKIDQMIDATTGYSRMSFQMLTLDIIRFL